MKLHLGDFEELVLLAIQKLGNDTYGTPVRKAIEEAGREVSVGALYTTFDRLKQKGFVTTWQGAPLPRRGGRGRRYYSIADAGREALRYTNAVRMRLG